MRAGVDVGGTFTDFVGVTPAGEWVQLKKPTTRPDPALGILAGLRELFGPDPQGLEVSHGTTAATNVALERRGPRTALVTTRGFRDILQLGRGERSDIYALQPAARPSLVDPEDCYEVTERLDARGSVLLALDLDECRELAALLQVRGIEAVAVCLLFSFLNPGHELQLAAILRAAGLAVSLSHAIDPQPKEYERASTTVMQAYVAPSLEHYLRHLQAGLAGAPLWVVRSSGTVCRPAEAIRAAVGCLLSGPAAGLQGAWQIARQLGIRRFITVDVGGTSSDVALCDGNLPFLEESALGGVPFRCPQADIHTVGAGGGSIARRDDFGLLEVGPASAGSTPGPAAYGQGGPVTVTDALLALGRLPSRLAGGRLPLDLEASGAALGALARELGLETLETAAAIVELAEQTMTQALRFISLERGHDPADFVLIAYGGGGGSHAVSLAERLGVRRVLIPPRPGLLCAYGALLAPWQTESRRSWCQPWTEAAQQDLQTWEREAQRALRGEAAAGKLRFQLWLELRYVGQGSSLWLRSGARLAQRFSAAHQRRYGYVRDAQELELVSSRLEGRQERTLSLPPAPTPSSRSQAGEASWGLPPMSATIEIRQGVTEVVTGPMRIETPDGTLWLPPGWRARPDPTGSLWVELIEKEEEVLK